MKKAITEKKSYRKGKYIQEYEPDFVDLTEQIMADAADLNASSSQMTLQDHLEVADNPHTKFQLQRV